MTVRIGWTGGAALARTLVAGTALSALLAGCAHHRADKGPPPPAPPAAGAPATVSAPATPQATPNRTPRQRFAAAVALLQQGNAAQARAELAALLADRPGDRHAQLLLSGIDTDPHQLFGNDSFVYTVRPGDTLASVARRFLHDPLNFYGLARFNNLTFPTELQPGQTIMVPGRVRAPERAPAQPRRTTPSTPPAQGTRPDEPARPAVSAGDRARAQRLREQGLEQMSAGSIDRAVQLLSQAAVLDPRNGAIAGELARARRIQATVHSR